jgi:hypothetical protein
MHAVTGLSRDIVAAGKKHQCQDCLLCYATQRVTY